MPLPEIQTIQTDGQSGINLRDTSDIRPGTRIITPNQRMALWWERSRCAPHSSVSALSTWVERLWEQYLQHVPKEPWQRLSSVAQEIVWEKIIQGFAKERSLLRVLPTARLAIKAWHLAQTWQIDLIESDLSAPASQEDARCFLSWAQQYRSWCETKAWLDTPALLDRVISLTEARVLLLPKHCLWVGFGELTPQQQRFWDALTRVGVQVSQLSLLPEQPQRVTVLGFKDLEEEGKVAMCWAASQLSLGFQKQFSIAIVVPNLSQHRPFIARLAARYLPKGSYNIAAPQMLLDYPLIQAAIGGLSLGKSTLDFLTVSRFLRSPFYGDTHDDQHERACLEVALRALGTKTLAWAQLLHHSRKYHLLYSVLQQLAVLRKALRGNKTAAEWKSLLSTWLQCLRWPGSQSLDAGAEQVYAQWAVLLDAYEALGPLLGKHRFGTAIFRLSSLARATPYAVASQSEPIQLLGILEAAGLPFKRLWVMGLHQAAWPLEPAPSPFLSYGLQRRYDLPRSSAHREYQVAERLTAELSRAAPQVIFSYPKQAEGQILHPSPLLGGFEVGLPATEWQALQEFLLQTEKKSGVGHPLVLSEGTIDFNEQAALFTKTDEILPGGTRVLALQGLCPFRAFAEIRLKAQAWPRDHLGLSAAQRGMILHDVLCVFWERVKTQRQLLAYDDITLQALVQDVIENTLGHWQAEHAHRLTATLFKMETIRLSRLLWAWLQLEKERPPFKVLATETNQIVSIQSLKLKIRLDRIDVLEDSNESEQNSAAEQFIIDYKTDKTASVQAWLGDTLLEPQLPLYAVMQSILPKAIGFAIVNADTMTFRGIGEVEACTGIREVTDWAAQLTQWREAIKSLVINFLQGDAQVNPLEGEKTCQKCHLSGLCRVFERHVV